MRYEMLVRDFFTGEVVGLFGTFNTMKDFKNQMFDIECLLQSSIVFSFEAVKEKTIYAKIYTLPQLLEEGQARQAKMETVEA